MLIGLSLPPQLRHAGWVAIRSDGTAVALADYYVVPGRIETPGRRSMRPRASEAACGGAVPVLQPGWVSQTTGSGSSGAPHAAYAAVGLAEKT